MPSTLTLWAAAFSFLIVTPGTSQAQSQQVDDLRRRIDVIEQQLFQQRLSQPPSLPSQAVQQLEARVRQLELDLASERVSRLAASVASRRSGTPEPKSLAARVQELEAQRADDVKTIAALTARVEKLEKPVVKRNR